MAAPLVSVRTPYTFSPVATGKLIGKPTPDQIRLLKQHVVAAALHVKAMKAQIIASEAAIAALDPADVNSVVVPGYPPAI